MRKLPLTALVLPLLFLGVSCPGLGPKGPEIKPITLEYWRIDDEPESMAAAVEAYGKLHPNVTVNYRKFRNDEYERELLEALAEDRGPDMFTIPNVWLRGWKPKLLPLPKETTIPTQVVDERKKIVTVAQKTPTVTIRELIDTYVETVTKDVILPSIPEKPDERPIDAIFALPYSLDTLGLYYNVDILKRANIEKPPRTWRELQEQAIRLTILDDAARTIKQSGAAIGTADNVLYATDILAALMSQNGAQMADLNGYATFERFTPETSDRPLPPGAEALVFYTSFADKGAPNYSWDETFSSSLDAFITGKTAFFFGYPIDAKNIRERAPRINFGVASIPQIDLGKVENVARYPVEVVSKKTDNPDEAWDFLQFASRADQVSAFLLAAKRPTALRSLIAGQITDPDVAPFASQILTAASWYKGIDFPRVEEIFADMINTKPTPERPEYQPIVGKAAGEVNGTIR